MSRHLRRSACTVAALASLVASGVGLAGVAAAAPTDPTSPTSSAPSSTGPTPQRPSVSDAPAPLLIRPVDASDGLFGMQRGNIHPASTPDMSQVPVARVLPRIGITPLPKQNQAADESSATASDDTSDTVPAADDSTAGSSEADNSAAQP
jgi:hypothetical protein